ELLVTSEIHIVTKQGLLSGTIAMPSWQSWWRSYRYRFVPWLVRTAGRQSSEASEQLPGDVGSSSDSHFRRLLASDSDLPTAKLAGFSSESELHAHLCDQMTRYLRCLVNNGNSCHGNDCLSRLFGYRLGLGPSSLPGGAGLGVFLVEGRAGPGSLLGLYPGTIYCQGDPALIVSIGNQFILRRADGILVDAGDSWLGRSVFRSCAGRDRLIGWEPAGSAWLSARRVRPATMPNNALATGHIVNNETGEDRPANVRYRELAWPVPAGHEGVRMLASLPCAFYSAEACRRWTVGAGLVPLVALVACRDVKAGEELLSAYVSLATG
ncbi:hypothetical protein BOX15_Mlig012570g1, partial [Macrostomum lignano]